MKLYVKFLMIAVVAAFICSCEDDIPMDYKPENIVEAILIVGEPIQNIKVLKSQPLYHNYNYYKSFIKDAEVIISGDGMQFRLLFNSDTAHPEYYFPDKSYLVKPATKYEIEVRLSDGKILTGETTTPMASSWLTKPKKFVQYPLDTLKLPSRDSISWQRVPGYDFYIVASICLDTLEYGKYLSNPTDEKNRRVYNPFASDRFYRELSTTSLVPSTQVPIVWPAFKWFGLHEVVIYTPDWNFTRWLLQNVATNSVNPLLGSIEGGVGVFGSASALRDTSFLMKNQP